ncbi:MAG: glycosyl transferase family protein [Firmicutes bacterium]|nr:glycosyl transferase family protein [Bacillota bacterium]
MNKDKRIATEIFLDFVEKYYYIFLASILLLASYVLFVNLNSVPIGNWDEARHGVNAYEMLKSKNFIVNTYGYQYDYYNMKPPLSYWLVIAGYKLAGFNPLGLRLSSAVSALLTIIIIAVFTKQKHGRIASIVSASVLTTTATYILTHCARTGDADAVFVLLFTIAMISMAKIDDNIKWLYLAGFSFSMAFLAKSWHASAIVAAGGLYLLFSGTMFKLKLKQWAVFIAAAVAPIGIWGIFRYANDGIEFFKGMINYDLLARTATPLEGHTGNAWYYFESVLNYYHYWFIILFGVFIGCLILTSGKIDKERRNYILAVFLWIAVPFISFSVAKTKLPWYIIPVYPALAVCIGAFTQKILRSCKRNFALQSVLIISLIMCFVSNKNAILNSVKAPQFDGTQSAIERLRDVSEYKGADAYTLCGTYGGAEHWDQNQFLAAELYADLKPIDGGIEAFRKDNNEAILIIPKNADADKIIKDNNLKVIIENDTNLILVK